MNQNPFYSLSIKIQGICFVAGGVMKYTNKHTIKIKVQKKILKFRSSYNLLYLLHRKEHHKKITPMVGSLTRSPNCLEFKCTPKFYITFPQSKIMSLGEWLSFSDGLTSCPRFPLPADKWAETVNKYQWKIMESVLINVSHF